MLSTGGTTTFRRLQTVSFAPKHPAQDAFGKTTARALVWDLCRNTREQVNITTYRTPDYMLSCAQDYRPGYGGDQQHIWQATLARRVCSRRIRQTRRCLAQLLGRIGTVAACCTGQECRICRLQFASQTGVIRAYAPFLHPCVVAVRAI